MHKLFAFLFSKLHWLVFVVLEVVALVWLFNERLYQRSIGLFSTNVVVGHIQTLSSELQSYMDLREANKQLLAENAALESKYLWLERAYARAAADTVRPLAAIPDSLLHRQSFDFRTARVVSYNDTNLNNHFTIDCGRDNGIRPDMPVMSATGVVGIVSVVSERYSVVIPLINPNLRLSCRVLGKGYVGSLRRVDADSRSTALLSDIPRHALIDVGDTIVTSGYSYTFPANLPVGYVSGTKNRKSGRASVLSIDGSEGVRVNLATDFDRLRFVYVMLIDPQAEVQAPEAGQSPKSKP